jgi:REP element-mobilizing transposase RayT
MSQPIYTPNNCPDPAFQWDWSYDAFWRESPRDAAWLAELQLLCEEDGIRILQHRFREPTISQLLVSTTPNVAPLTIVMRLKGRLKHLVRDVFPKVFRRNYGLRSVGSTRREKLDHYLAGQLDHHRMADPNVPSRLREYQIYQPQVDLSQPRRTAHAIYWYNLHVVIVNDSRYMEIRHEILRDVREMILRASRIKAQWISRAAIVPDHIHLTLGCSLENSPEEVVLAYMNNLAYACGMKPVFKYGYFAGTFSEYDLGVIPRP